MRSRKMGVFGGSFDPPHIGHVALAAMAIAAEGLDRLLIIPCFEHALGKQLTPFGDRFEMCERAFAGLEKVDVSDLESHLGGTSYTLDTLSHLRKSHPDSRLVLVIGADAMEQRHSWHRFDRIEALAQLLVFARAGVDSREAHLPAPPDVSATEVRRRLMAGEDVRGLAPHGVIEYIREHNLYVEPR